jgi:hypothetical protein
MAAISEAARGKISTRWRIRRLSMHRKPCLGAQISVHSPSAAGNHFSQEFASRFPIKKPCARQIVEISILSDFSFRGSLMQDLGICQVERRIVQNQLSLANGRISWGRSLTKSRFRLGFESQIIHFAQQRIPMDAQFFSRLFPVSIRGLKGLGNVLFLE